MSATSPAPRLIQPGAHRLRRRIVNSVMLSLTAGMTIVALIPLVWIVAYVVVRGAPQLSLSFFTELPGPMGRPGGGVLHAIEGTIILTVLAACFAVPPGIAAAVYAAKNPNTPLGIGLRFATDVLSGVPSIVVGLFCYALLVKPQGHFSALAGGIALAILMLPLIIRTTEEMIKLVPGSLAEGALALGAPDWRTTLSVVLPAATSGIVTGVLLGLARVSGETAPLLFTALGNERFDAVRLVKGGLQSGQGLGVIAKLLEQPIDSLPLTLWKYSQQPFPERVDQAWAAALVLMVFVLAVNLGTRAWVAHRSRRMRA